MKIAVTTTVVFDLPEHSGNVEQVKDRLLRAHELCLDKPMWTITGQQYVLRRIERFEVAELDRPPNLNLFPSTI